MAFKRGHIHLANLNPQKRPNEVAKTRPVLVLQNDLLADNDYPTTIVLPVSSDLVDDAEPMRYRVSKREKLEQDSDVLIAQIRAIDNTRMGEYLGGLDSAELRSVEGLLVKVLGIISA